MNLRSLVYVLLACLLIPAAAVSVQAHAAPSIGMVTRHWHDASRQDWQQTGTRPLKTVIWYPAASDAKPKKVTMGPPGKPLFVAGRAAQNAALSSAHKKYPLILLSHGSGGSALQMMWLGQYLAEHGYIVAAVNHCGNTGGAGTYYTPQGFMLWWERAQDLRVVRIRVYH